MFCTNSKCPRFNIDVAAVPRYCKACNTKLVASKAILEKVAATTASEAGPRVEVEEVSEVTVPTAPEVIHANESQANEEKAPKIDPELVVNRESDSTAVISVVDGATVKLSEDPKEASPGILCERVPTINDNQNESRPKGGLRGNDIVVVPDDGGKQSWIRKALKSQVFRSGFVGVAILIVGLVILYNLGLNEPELQGKENMKEMLAKGYVCMEKKEYACAMVYAQSALKLDPNDRAARDLLVTADKAIGKKNNHITIRVDETQLVTHE